MKREELSSLRPVSFGRRGGGRLGNGASAAAWCKIHQLQIKDTYLSKYPIGFTCLQRLILFKCLGNLFPAFSLDRYSSPPWG